MKIRFDRPVSTAARFSQRCAALAFVLALGTIVAHRFAGLSTPNMVVLLGLAIVLAGLAVLLAVAGLHSLWTQGAEGGLQAMAALILAAPPLALGAFAAERYLMFPQIYDVTSDTGTPPEWLSPPSPDQGLLPPRTLPTPDDRQAQAEAYPELTGRRYDGAVDRVLDVVKKVAKLQGIQIVRSQGDREPEQDLPSGPVRPNDNGDAVPDAPDLVPVPTPRPFDDDVAQMIRRANGVTLQGEIRTLALGLRFDVVIRLREEAETTLVDIRVASRYGPHDLGFSKTIAEDYLKALDSELLGIAGS